MAARFPEGGQDQDSSGSWDGSDLMLDSAIQEKPKHDERQPDQPQQPVRCPESDFTILMELNDINELKSWIRKHFRDIEGYAYYRDELEYIISQYIPAFRPGTVDKPSIIITLLKKILPVKERGDQKYFCHRDFIGKCESKYVLHMTEINLSTSLAHILEGSKLAANVEKHKERIMDNMLSVEIEMGIMSDEIKRCHAYIEELEVKLAAALKIIQTDEERMFGPVPENEPRFLADMHMNLKVREDLESSLHDELTRSRNFIDRLTSEVTRLKRELLTIDHERIKELAEIAQDMEIDERLKRSLIEKINTLNASAEDCNQAIAEWMSTIHESFNEKRESIEKTREELKKLDNEVAKHEAEVQDLACRRNEINMEISALRESIAEEEIEFQSLEHYISQLEEEKLHLSRQADQTNQESASILASTPSRSPGLFTSRYIPYMDSSDVSNILDSPEQLRTGDSPGHWQERFDDTGSLSLDSSRDEELPEIRISPPSPIDSDASYNIHIPSPIAPGTQTISQPRSGFFPSTSKVNPSTQTIQNRIDVGQSLNMKTVQSGLTSPYHQNTRLVSNIPVAGPSRMVDSPFNIKHKADVTPSRFVTPFISTTRFGYTDPKAKILNLPPGDNYDLDTVLKKRLLLTSPQREEPLLVDIGVQPKPLIQTSSGEHFVCDISLDVQKAGKKQPYISPVFTRGTPPAVTPTITRRELAAPFTPKGVFMKKHFNVRRVIGPHYESPGKYFPPHYLPFDSRSPVSDIPHDFNSPCYSDGTISWEKVPGLDSTYDACMMNTTFGRSPSPVIKRPFDRSASPVMNSTYEESPSPVIKGPSHRFRMQESFTSSDLSDSPVHGRTFDSSSSSRSGGTYDSHMSPRLNVTYDRSSSPSSISPRLDATFDSSSSSRSGGTYDSHMSRSGGTYDSHMSPRLNVTYDRSSSPSSISPRLDATFDRSMSPRSGDSYDRSMSPRSGGTYDRSMSPRSGGTYDRSMSPRLDATFDSSMSPRLDATFDSSMSPRSGGTYDRSMSPRSGGTYDRSMSPRSGGTYDRSMSPRLDATFVRSKSPRLDHTSDSSFSSLNRAFIQSPSTGMDGSIGRSPSPRLDNTFEQSPSSLNRAHYPDGSPQSDDSRRRAPPRNGNFGNFPRVNRTRNVSISDKLNKTYNVSHPYLMDRPFIESPQSNRSFSPQRFNESDRSSLNRTFDTYSSQNSALSDEDWSFDSGYSSYVSNQSGHSERSP